jgi:hypothetical protein
MDSESARTNVLDAIVFERVVVSVSFMQGAGEQAQQSAYEGEGNSPERPLSSCLT